MEYSDKAISILSLLNNAKDLVFHSDRQNAQTVLNAVEIYAHKTGYPIADEKFENFSRVLLDSRQDTLTYLINEIAHDVLEAETHKLLQKKKAAM